MMRVAFVGLLVAVPAASAFLVSSGPRPRPSPPPPRTAAPAPSCAALTLTTRRVVLRAAPTRASDATALDTADAFFDAIDANGDGAISGDELRGHLTGRGCAPTAISALFTALDKNDDGAISREEMRFAFENYETFALYQALGVGSVSDATHGAAVAAIRFDAKVDAGKTRESDATVIDARASPFDATADAIFDVIDSNGDGAISNDELRSHLGGIGCAPATIRALFTAIDKNADGAISRGEMRFAFAHYETSALYQAFGVGDARLSEETHSAAVAAIRADAKVDADKTAPALLTKLADLIFDMLDADGSGQIDSERLRAHFLKNGDASTFREIGNASAVSADAVLTALDLNRDGVISREEMRDGFQQYDLQALSRALGLPASR